MFINTEEKKIFENRIQSLDELIKNALLSMQTEENRFNTTIQIRYFELVKEKDVLEDIFNKCEIVKQK